jgi:hypothetical protein
LPDRKDELIVNTDALESFAAARKPKTAAEWRAPVAEDFVVEGYYGRTVLCADPSLRKFAAVLLTGYWRTADDTLMLRVLAAKKFSTASHEAGGYEESLRKSLDLVAQLTDWIPQAAAGETLSGIEVVHEGPPIGGGVMVRPEASLLGGMALRVAAQDLGMAVRKMVMPQSHKRFITNIPKATKAQAHSALKTVAVDLGIQGMEKITNEDLRDALLVGLVHLTRPQEK